jgi:hypothetical protein
MAKRPLAICVEPTRVPLTYSPVLGGGECQPALGSHRPAHAVHFGTLEIGDKIFPDYA